MDLIGLKIKKYNEENPAELKQYIHINPNLNKIMSERKPTLIQPTTHIIKQRLIETDIDKDMDEMF